MSKAQLISRHTPEDICKIMGGLTRAQAMEILASKGLREGDPDIYAHANLKQVRFPAPQSLHDPLKEYWYRELLVVGITPIPLAYTPELIPFEFLEWRPKQYTFGHWVHLYWSSDHGRQVSCGYRQTYSWFEWELKGE